MKALFQTLTKLVAVCAIILALGFFFQVSPAAAQAFNWGGDWGGFPGYYSWGGFPGYYSWGGFPGYYWWWW